MDWKDFTYLPWRFSCHLACADEHCITRTAEKDGHYFGLCVHTPTDEWKIEHPHARRYEHYAVDGAIYKTKAKLLKAIAEI